jgi:hypothetical protein
MSLTTSSADAIVHSTPLNKFAVTGRYQVRPGILKKNISTQQSTWIEHWKMAAAVAVALEDGGGALAFGGGFGLRLKIAVAVLGSGCGRRTCNDGIGISVIKAEGYYHNVGISIGKDGKRGGIQCKAHTLAVKARR